MTSNLSNDLTHCLSIAEHVSFDIYIIKIETVLAEIRYFLFWFDAFAAILKICPKKCHRLEAM